MRHSARLTLAASTVLILATGLLAGRTHAAAQKGQRLGPAAHRDATTSGPVRVTRDVIYGSSFNQYTQTQEDLVLDVYRMDGPTTEPRPAVVLIHGGGFVAGDKAVTPMRYLGRDLAREGYVVASINYRLAPPGTTITEINLREAADDARAAVRYLRARADELQVDPSRIACMGSSAGAFTALRVAYIERSGTSGNPGFSEEVSAVVDLWGGMLNVDVVEGDEAPLMIVHGDQDPTVSYALALELDARAGSVLLPHEFLTLEGAGHGPWSRYAQESHAQVVDFLARALE
ncbi:MAG: alpha/beta hydrolase [Planctomycetota bacterium]